MIKVVVKVRNKPDAGTTQTDKEIPTINASSDRFKETLPRWLLTKYKNRMSVPKTAIGMWLPIRNVCPRTASL